MKGYPAFLRALWRVGFGFRQISLATSYFFPSCEFGL